MTRAVHAALLPGEQPLILLSISRARRQADYLALTDRRVLTWVRAPGDEAKLVDDIDGASIVDVAVSPDVMKKAKAAIATTTGMVDLGTVIRTNIEELQYLERTLMWLRGTQPTDELRAQRHAQLVAELGENGASLTTATVEQRKAMSKETRRVNKAARQADKDARAAQEIAVISEAQIYGDGKPTRPLLRTIAEICSDDERPWFVLVSLGEGALVAFEDRAAVIKVGAYTALMAGAMGGGRVATFHFSDITGIEYNSQIITGVLEILTPSYQGTANKDYWRGSTRSRNADANDPHTLSNTLPLQKHVYRAALPGLNELRARIGRAKQPTIVVPASNAPAASVTEELVRLAELHKSGVLTDEEFQQAKTALIARM